MLVAMFANEVSAPYPISEATSPFKIRLEISVACSNMIGITIPSAINVGAISAAAVNVRFTTI